MRKIFVLLIFFLLSPLFAESFVDGESFTGGSSFTDGESFVSGESFTGGSSFVDGESFVGGESFTGGRGQKIGVYESVVEPARSNIYDSTEESVYADIHSDIYANGYGKYLKIMASKGVDARSNFVKYFSDWQWSGQKKDFYSYAESRAEQERRLAKCYDAAIKKFGIGTALVATTWIVSLVVPGGQIFSVAIVVIAKATTVGALSGGALGAVSSAGIAYLQGKRGNELLCETISGAADGYLIGAITGLAEGTFSAVKMIKDAPKFLDAAKETKTVLNGKVYNSKGWEIGKYCGEYPKPTINMSKAGTVYNGVRYEWQLVQDAQGNFYKAVMPQFEGVKIKFPDELQFAGRKAHNDYVLKVLNSPELCAKNGISEKQAKYILEHYDDFTVHHLGERNTVQLVDSEIHSSVRHTGGYSMWGK